MLAELKNIRQIIIAVAALLAGSSLAVVVTKLL